MPAALARDISILQFTRISKWHMTHFQIRNSFGAPIGPVTIGRGKHSSVLGCTIGLLPAALKDLTSVEPDLLRRAAQPRSMIQSLASVLHPHISHIYGVLEAEGVSGVVSSHVPGCPLSDLPVHRIHIQVRPSYLRTRSFAACIL